MKLLLWKDYRLSRICMLAGMMLITMPYLTYFYPYTYFEFDVAWTFSIFTSQFTMAILAGNIIAGERVDRSAEFLAFQGASRKMLITSKLIICTLVFALICCINLILSLWLKPMYETWAESLIGSILLGVCFFGCCWLLSSLLSSPAYALIFGSIIPPMIIWAIGKSAYYFHWSDRQAWAWSYAIWSVVGLISLLAGTLYYIRSKE